jgi:hypothetical protein
MWDLGRQFMEGERRYEIDHCMRDFNRHGNQIGLAERRHFSKPVKTSRKLLDLSGVTHRVQRIAGDSAPNNIGHPQDSTLLTK